MKKIISVLLVAIFVLSLIACSSTTPTPSVTPTLTPDGTTTATPSAHPSSTPTLPPDGIDLKIFAMKGPTGMGMAKMIADGYGSSNYSFDITLADNVNEMLSDLIGGKFDIAAVPTNFAASVLNNKAAGTYSVVAVNTLGVLYILDKDGTIQSTDDLKGKHIYATGEGTVPQFVLEYVLKKSGLEIGKDVEVSYLESAAAVGQILTTDKASVAMLPQPYVTTLLTKSPDIKVALDLTAEWDRLCGGESRLMTGCIVVKNSLLENDPQLVDAFLNDYKASVEFVNTASDEAAQAVVDAGIVGAVPVAKNAIPKCNIVFITGDEMKKDLLGFYTALHSINPKSVGGKIPGDEIFGK